VTDRLESLILVMISCVEKPDIYQQSFFAVGLFHQRN